MYLDFKLLTEMWFKSWKDYDEQTDKHVSLLYS